MNKAMVSIIIPIYNVRDYLARCISSILDQSYKNYEIILVDDASTDGSFEMCKAFSEQDTRIKVFQTSENNGAASARVEGIRIATGDYIMFVDGDDWLHPNMVEVLVSAIKKMNCDIIQCGFEKKMLYEIDEVEVLDYRDIRVFDSRDAIYQLYGESEKSEFNFILWNKIFSHKLFQNIELPTSNFKINDVPFIPRIFYHAKNIGVCDNKYYYYYHRNTEISKSTMDQIKSSYLQMSYEHFLAFSDVSNYFKNIDSKLYAVTLKYTLSYALSVLKAYGKNHTINNEAIIAIKSAPYSSFKYLSVKKSLACLFLKLFSYSHL